MQCCTEQLVLDVAQAVRDTFTRWAGCTYRQCRRAAIVVDQLLKECGCPTAYTEVGWLGQITLGDVPPARNTGHVWNVVLLDHHRWLLDVTADQYSILLRKPFPSIIWGPYKEMVTRYGYIPDERYKYKKLYDVNPQLYVAARHYLHTGEWLEVASGAPREYPVEEARREEAPLVNSISQAACLRVSEPLLDERVVHHEDIDLEVGSGYWEPWTICYTEGKTGQGYITAGRVIIGLDCESFTLMELPPSLVIGLVWVVEHGQKKIVCICVDAAMRRRGIGRVLIDAYRRRVSKKLYFAGPFSKAGLAFAREMVGRVGGEVEPLDGLRRAR